MQFERVENIVGIINCQHFIPFPQCFQRPSISGSLSAVVELFNIGCTRPSSGVINISGQFLKTLREKDNMLETSIFLLVPQCFHSFNSLPNSNILD